MGIYLIELIMPGTAIAFVLLSDPYKSYILVGTITLSIIAILV